MPGCLDVVTSASDAWDLFEVPIFAARLKQRISYALEKLGGCIEEFEWINTEDDSDNEDEASGKKKETRKARLC